MAKIQKTGNFMGKIKDKFGVAGLQPLPFSIDNII
jgi:hypothetical protein|tara:strand:- start:1684 stop:1788 length:105 start_codon:yes stop_codon:yes gene_type:complete